MNQPGWLRLGALRATELVPARLELHWALQVPAALGIARATPAPDFAHHSVHWDPSQRALVGARVEKPRAHRAGLRFEDLALLLLSEKDALVEALPLAGRTLAEAFAWLDAASARYTGVEQAPLARPQHELADHPLAHGARFCAAPAAGLHELARWFEDLAGVLGARRDGREATPVRVWSHHFDMDTVLTLGGERTLGLGFSPGDDSYAEPYLYALPTPYPDERALPELAPPMEWVTDGWIGAVLRGSHVAALAPAAQAELAARFYRAAEEALAKASS